KRITSLTKKQWRALEKSLAFKREDRIESVEDLYEELTVKYTPSYKLATALALVLSVTITAYFLIFTPGSNDFSESDIRNELEYKITLDLHKTTITKLLDNPLFSPVWEGDLWSEVQSIREMIDEDDDWLIATTTTIYKAYVEKINSLFKDKNFNQLNIIIVNAYRYTRDHSFLDQNKLRLAELIKQEEIRKKQLAISRANKQETVLKNEKEKKKTTDLFDLALKSTNQQLECQSKLNMRNLSTAIGKLRDLDASRYKKIEPKLVNSLAACIAHEGLSFPDRANEDKKLAIRLFNSHPVIVNLKIKPKDPCDESIAGLGARGKRTQCQDKIAGAGTGPSLVVVPSAKGQQPFAIGKYEVSISELNDFCKSSNLCSEVKDIDLSLPATNVSFDIVKEYLKWLSKKTDQKYRLPARHEWVYAAKSRREQKDPNRNCMLSSRGIQKGGELVTATTGKQNAWGLVNYAGNAEEWVYDKGRSLVAVGGSYESPMDNCDISTSNKHNGKASKLTGFRVLRELKR
ncbi:MAG: formylglycine-generating enzyme family protein, partial [Gammaproteobacteria bacterium]|nr:formylglycine-generating enzyme family protein [Gammaproteobacteria bacterium]